RTAQSLTNLISNALKFTPQGGSIEITAEEGAAKHSGFVVVSVKDTGCGIAPEDILKVFGYFVQVGPQGNRPEGSGLGLSLARSMVELQGGTMWVTSRPGEGSTFSFTLPLFVPGTGPAPAADAAAA
ncbi:MAG TPA: ATP-binding protein, partial [Elusimicrobiales bacterium]|nr:ATP-binding protein [Elusimicrobiales bacterium]